MENMDWVRYFWIALSWSFWGWFMLFAVFLVGMVLRFFWKVAFPPYSSPSPSFRDHPSTIEEGDTWDDIRRALAEEQKKEWEDEDRFPPRKSFIGVMFSGDDDDDDEDEDEKGLSYSAWDIFR